MFKNMSGTKFVLLALVLVVAPVGTALWMGMQWSDTRRCAARWAPTPTEMTYPAGCRVLVGGRFVPEDAVREVRP